MENWGGTQWANYRCQVSGWKVHFWCFLWKRKRAATGCGGILCGFTHLKPSRLMWAQPFLYDNKWRWEGSWSLGLVSLSEVILFLQSPAVPCKSNVFNLLDVLYPTCPLVTCHDSLGSFIAPTKQSDFWQCCQAIWLHICTGSGRVNIMIRIDSFVLGGERKSDIG